MSRYIDIDELEPDTEWDDYTDGFISYSSRQILNSATVDVIPVSKVEEWLTTMRKGVYESKQDMEKIYGSGTGYRDYTVGQLSAISYLEGSLAEWKQLQDTDKEDK